jgi:hypothetical protein
MCVCAAAYCGGHKPCCQALAVGVHAPGTPHWQAACAACCSNGVPPASPPYCCLTTLLVLQHAPAAAAAAGNSASGRWRAYLGLRGSDTSTAVGVTECHQVGR